jgi:hypothetical protein
MLSLQRGAARGLRRPLRPPGRICQAESPAQAKCLPYNTKSTTYTPATNSSGIGLKGGWGMIALPS